MLKFFLEQYYTITKGYYPFFKICHPKYWDYFLQKRYEDAKIESKNFNNPVTFNEKIRYLVYNEHTELKTKLTDKILVKDYVDEKLGTGYCQKIYGIWDKFEDIDFDNLPDKFALKANHGSKMNIFIGNKNKLNRKKIKYIKKITNNWLKANYFYFCLEPQYKNINKKLFAEELYSTKNGYFQVGYQIHCFNGQAKFIEVVPPAITLPFNEKRTIQFYDRNWIHQPFTYKWIHNSKDIDIPSLLSPQEHKLVDKICDYAQILSQDFAYVRVDFTISNEKIIFEEMTFSPNAGMFNFNLPEYDYILGNMIKLP